ncbi:MAG: hypothetical protein AzoDbin1_04232 [Azoarcus sp.]|nr:hypothetical protein [Azoarcus sp.]
MSAQDNADRHPLRGHLVIHVGGYKQMRKCTFHVFSSHPTQLIPDRFVGAATYPTDTPEWSEEGWAVGDNPRDRFCKWNGTKPVRRFKDYDEAVRFVFRLRQKRKRPNEAYTLVYVTRNGLGKDVSQAVSSLDDIEAIELQLCAERTQIETEQANYRAQLEIERPAYAQLREAYGPARGFTLSDFLKRVREQGLAAVKAQHPHSSFYRNVRELRALGLID